MPSLLTFGELKDSDVPDVAGVCATSDQFKAYVNKATRMLMRRSPDDPASTIEKIMVCSYNDCIVWPRYVGAILAVNFMRHSTKVLNNWYSFMPLSRGDFGSSGFRGCHGHYYGNINVENDAYVPVFNPIACNEQYYIRVYPSTQEDVGKTVTIFGIDENGQVIRTGPHSGIWQEGVTLTLAIPFVSTSFKVREVTRITKEATQGVVRYYQYDPDRDVHIDLVSHDPGELTPMYLRSRLPKRNRCGTSCPTTPCSGLASIEAMVSLEFQPVSADTDLVLISNQDALRDMIRSIRESDNGDKAAALAYETSAIHELNIDYSSRFPEEQTPVVINPFGVGGPDRHWVGRII